VRDVYTGNRFETEGADLPLKEISAFMNALVATSTATNKQQQQIVWSFEDSWKIQTTACIH
jgi:hypothetical protein